MSKSNDHYLGVIIEDMYTQLQQIHEIVSTLIGIPQRLSSLEAKFDKMSKEHNVFFLALKDTNKQVNNHEHRITKLETA